MPDAAWWVNHGPTYDDDRRAGVVFSSLRPDAGQQRVSEMAPGDVVVHCVHGQVVAIGEVVVGPAEADRPYGPPDHGWLTRVEYLPLERPISVEELPSPADGAAPVAGNGVGSPDYLVKIDESYSELLRTQFADDWPPGSPWHNRPRRCWMFQANPKQWSLVGHLPGLPPGALEDWIVSRYRQEMQPGDGVVLWEAGPNAGVYALARLVSTPRPTSRSDYRPTSSGRDEYNVAIVIERHLSPPITRPEARAHPVLSGFDVLRQPQATNFRVTREQWQAVWSLASFDPGPRRPVKWQPLVKWAKRIADVTDLDEQERSYKLEIRDHVDAAAEAVRADEPGWTTILRRAFGSPNNLTAWRMHGKFLDWVEEEPDAARGALLELWNVDWGVRDAVDAFCTHLPPDLSAPGAQTNLASFLLAARGIERYPIYKVTPFMKAYRLTGWEQSAEVPPGTRYIEAIDFLDGFLAACRAEGATQIRDRLDAQGLLWQLMSGNAPPGWSAADVAAYRMFLEGHVMSELDELVEQFRAEADYPTGGRPERFAQREGLAAGLTSEALADPDPNLLRGLAGKPYGSPGSQPGLYRLLKTDKGLADLADTLRYLLDGPGEVVERLDECLNAEDHKLPGVAEAILVKALAARYPERWIPCYVTRGKVGKIRILELLGETVPEASSTAAAAATTNDRLRELLEPHLPGDPWGMQEFTWWLLHREHVPDAPLRTLAEELYLSEEFLERILRLLDDKGQVVFYGPPGTGKTFVARELAGYIARGGGQVEKVQFHPSYAYEDFIEGYRPRLRMGQVTYEVVDGPLKRMAAVAEERPDLTHVLIIDELNRGNVAKVLGELMFLLEYRDEEIRLQYSDAPFALPQNLQIIATMNTADRSIALVDTALRRRFHFVPFFPDTEPIDTLLNRWLQDQHPSLAWVSDLVGQANEMLADRNLAIGPSHFMRPKLTEELVRLAWENSVLPFLEEHFFTDPDQLTRFNYDHLKARATGNPPPPSSVIIDSQPAESDR